MEEEGKYYVVRRKAIPEVLLRVVETKKHIPLFSVLTKADKCKQQLRRMHQTMWQRLLSAKTPPMQIGRAHV